MRLLGIHGLKKSGKTTFAEAVKKHIDENYQYNVVKTGFAEPLKECCKILFGGADKNYYGTDDEKNEKAKFWEEVLGPKFASYRNIMQSIGTDIFRDQVDKDFWLAVMLRKINYIKTTPCNLMICDDIRFTNEADFIKAKGGVIIKVESNRTSQNKDAHSSEAGLPIDFPYEFIVRCDRIDEMNEEIKTKIAPYITRTMRHADG